MYGCPHGLARGYLLGYNKKMLTKSLDTGSLRQLVPSNACLTCDVCCRFIDRESPLRPYFNKDEIWRLIEAGISPRPFRRLDGCKIELIPYRDLYICPFFMPGENRCSIYNLRPLDCRIYPIAVMKAQDGSSILIGVDTKCPYSKEARRDDVKCYTEILHSLIEQEEASGIIGDFQDDVRVISLLDREIAGKERSMAIPSNLRSLDIGDKPIFDSLLFGISRLSSHSFITNFIWRGLFNYYWGIIEGCLCLFAEYDQNIYMPLPPLGNNPKMASAAAFEMMDIINKNPSISRIENLDDNEMANTMLPSHRHTLKGYEYIYMRDDLISLKGNAYKGKRHPYNYFVKRFNYSYEPFTSGDIDGCLLLYTRWMKDRYMANQDCLYRGMLYDSYSAHRLAMFDYNDLGLIGRIVRIDGAVSGYTFGFKLGPDIVTVLLEITDRSVRGLSQFIFREFCKELRSARFINTMDDSWLENIEKAKLSYHPCRLEPSYIIFNP